MAITAGCTTQGDLSDEERGALEQMVIDDSTPILASPTNRFADDPKAAALGHTIFFDKRMISGAGGCRTCHDTRQGGADTKSRTPTTVFGTQVFSRNTPTIFNAAFIPGVNHWGGLFSALWSVPTDVGTSALEQAHFIYADPAYRQAYEELFGPMPDLTDTVRFPPIGNYRTPAWMAMAPDDQKAMSRIATNLGKSLEAYERKLVDKNSAFDRYMNGEETALNASAIRGAKLFIGKAACNECHNGPAFSDFKFHNVGVPQGALARDFGFISAGAFQSTYPFNANSEFSDDPAWGANVTADIVPVLAADLPIVCGSDPVPGCGAFKTARLRSVSLTAPYMHTGGFTDLWDVVAFYNEGAGTDGYVGHRDPAIRPLYLSNDEITDLVEFLRSLAGAPIPDEWALCPPTLAADACMAP
ncbi:MAG: cytochrome c peroxidase [Kofleriaceae bacterium]